MIFGVPRERYPDERRVALIPAHVAALTKVGHKVIIEAEAGTLSGYPDAAYAEKGVTIVNSRSELFKAAECILCVRAGSADPDHSTKDLESLSEGKIIIGMLDPYQKSPVFNSYKDKRITAFSMELIPRITRAQSMDVLSSMANLAGYKGALLAAEHLPKVFPMMMTAAGTVVPAKVFVLGAGVAGLQAIATAKRLGAVVSAFDVRPAVKEQVESLGAKFVEFDLGSSAEGQGGYARELTPEEKAKQQSLMEAYVKDVDVIIATAAVPGRPSPKLINEVMVKNLPPGSVIIDLASERGGNCELTQPGKTIVAHGVTIVAPLNLASATAFHASQLYSKNLQSFLALLFDKEGKFNLNVQDEIVGACLVTHAGSAGNEKIAQVLGL